MTHPYWPRRHGRYVKYNVAEFRGAWSPGNMSLPIRGETVRLVAQHRLTTVKAGAMWGLTYGPVDQVIDKPADGWATLYQDDDADTVGERTAGWGIGIPGVPLLLHNTGIVGPESQKDIDSTIWLTNGNDTTKLERPFRSRVGIVHKGPWDRWQDVVISALWEDPGGGGEQLYNYAFVRDFGLTTFWYGWKDPVAGDVSGYLYHATEWGDA